MAAIDAYLPAWDVNEVHETVVAATPERALEALLATPAAADPAVRALLRLRGVSRRGSVADLLAGIGFEPLARQEDEVVFGASGRPWWPSRGMRRFADAAPGSVRVAVNLRVAPLPGGKARLSTETRIAAADARARRAFRRYWLVVGPFSALIRRRWLEAARRTLAA